MHPVARLTLGSCMLCSDCRFGPIGVQKFRRKNNDFVDCNEYREASVRSFVNPKGGAGDRLTVAIGNLYAC